MKTAAFAISAFFSALPCAIAQDAYVDPTSSTEPDWQVRAALYGWGTALEGDIQVLSRTAPIEAEFGDLLNHLDSAFMGALEIAHGRTSLIADVFFAEVGGTTSKGALEFNAQINQFIGNFALTHNLIDDFDTRLDIYAGARVNSQELDLEITRTGPIRKRTFQGSESEYWVDPILGARYQQDIAHGFFLRAAGDIGGFGVSSNLTWQAMAGIGYHIHDNASMVLGYRGIGTDYENGGFGYNLTNHGLLLGFEMLF